MKNRLRSAINNFNDPAFMRYLVIGVLSFAIDLILFNILHFGQNWELVPANMTSLFLSMVFNYIATNYWTFKIADGGNKEKIGRYIIISIFNYIVNNILFYVIAAIIGVPANIAKVIVISLQVSWTFLIYKFWVFR